MSRAGRHASRHPAAREDTVIGQLRIGTSGYGYRHWRGVLYPPGLRREEWLGHYAARFTSVELNSTFYGLPSRDTVARWRAEVPEHFIFAAKLSRYGTHLKRLKDPADWISRFLDSLEPLGSALGPILVQLPPRWHRDVARLRAFLDIVPQRRRWALEVRDPDWFDPSVYELLRAHGVALCVHDLLADHPRLATADWVYLRFHGPDPTHPYRGSYPVEALKDAARRIRDHLQAGRDIYAYFNNDIDGAAVQDAIDLTRFVGASGAGEGPPPER